MDLNNEIRACPVLKVCQECFKEIELPNEDNLCIIKKGGKFEEVCKKCYEKHKEGE